MDFSAQIMNVKGNQIQPIAKKRHLLGITQILLMKYIKDVMRNVNIAMEKEMKQIIIAKNAYLDMD